MDGRERVLTTLAHQKPDRAPFNFWMDRRLMAVYAARLGGDDFRVRHYDADVVETFPLLAWPHGPTVDHDGSPWQTGPFLDDWADADALPLPDPHDPAAFACIRRDVAAHPDRAIFLDTVTPWGIACGIRTYELILMDMVLYPDALHALLKRIEQVYVPFVERACAMGVTALYLMEDLASARGLLFSREMIREFCLDYVRSLVAIARAHDIPVLWHSDGRVVDLLDLLEEIGVVAVNPLQPHLHDLRAFRREYAGRLTLYGGLDNCYIIPDGSADDVRRHVLDTFDAVGREGGLILSTHDIPIDTPPENIETLVRTIVEECRY